MMNADLTLKRPHNYTLGYQVDSNLRRFDIITRLQVRHCMPK